MAEIPVSKYISILLDLMNSTLSGFEDSSKLRPLRWSMLYMVRVPKITNKTKLMLIAELTNKKENTINLRILKVSLENQY